MLEMFLFSLSNYPLQHLRQARDLTAPTSHVDNAIYFADSSNAALPSLTVRYCTPPKKGLVSSTFIKLSTFSQPLCSKVGKSAKGRSNSKSNTPPRHER